MKVGRADSAFYPEGSGIWGSRHPASQCWLGSIELKAIQREKLRLNVVRVGPTRLVRMGSLFSNTEHTS